MTRFKPLSPREARTSLQQRLSRTVDRIQQRVNGFGVSPLRVWLVWTRYDGEERGEGNQKVLARVEILPTPRVSDLTAVTYRTASAGMYPAGSVRIDQLSAFAFSEDELKGLKIPRPGGNGQPALPPAGCVGDGFDTQYDAQTTFQYWIQEDGRGDDPARIKTFKLLADPWRDTNGFGWTILLERADRDPRRDGTLVNVGVGQAERRRMNDD